jgi:hypothetical protein
MWSISPQARHCSKITAILEVRLGYAIGKGKRGLGSKYEITDLTASSRFLQPYCATSDQKLRASARRLFGGADSAWERHGHSCTIGNEEKPAHFAQRFLLFMDSEQASKRIWRSIKIMQFRRHCCVRRTRDGCLEAPNS